jgi:UDP-N-acetylmuramoyl-tripeptide--D-alanyl-D-alanine ligase
MKALVALVLGLAVCSLVPAYLRWLRVAQREHYLPGMTLAFARRWWGSSLLNLTAFAVGIAGALASLAYPPAGIAAAVVAGFAPFGLSVRGRTSKLSWTRRLRRLAAVSGLSAAVAIGASALAGEAAAASAAALCTVASPLLVDTGAWLMAPVERRLLLPYIQRARRRLEAVSPRVVAVTGSFGKTTTKGYIAHLLAGSYSVVPTPASYNNAAGLARAINEQLPPGTEVFVAEMGTYGVGEIAAMCRWVAPEVSVITAIGPVHLERMGSLEKIAEAKAEILGPARVAVLNVDYPLLDELARKAEAQGKQVWRCSAQWPADVSVVAEGDKLRVSVGGRGGFESLVESPPEVSAGNVACAVAAALSLGVPPQLVASRLDSLPGAPHRRSPTPGPGGVLVIDDTYNSNPAGAKAALDLLARLGGKSARKAVVTPGMVELGKIQAQENAKFAALAGEVATDLVAVGRTNAKALAGGARAAGLRCHFAADRAAALAWVRANLRPGDVVLYENDLPDHYP